jgi:hypothetical protein
MRCNARLNSRSSGAGMRATLSPPTEMTLTDRTFQRLVSRHTLQARRSGVAPKPHVAHALLEIPPQLMRLKGDRVAATTGNLDRLVPDCAGEKTGCDGAVLASRYTITAASQMFDPCEQIRPGGPRLCALSARTILRIREKPQSDLQLAEIDLG